MSNMINNDVIFYINTIITVIAMIIGLFSVFICILGIFGQLDYQKLATKWDDNLDERKYYLYLLSKTKDKKKKEEITKIYNLLKQDGSVYKKDYLRLLKSYGLLRR